MFIDCAKVTINSIRLDYNILEVIILILSMHSLAAASWPRLSETEPKWFEFETSCYAFGGRIRSFAKVNVNQVNIFYCIVLILVSGCSFLCTLSLYWQYIHLHSVIAAHNEGGEGLTDWQTNQARRQLRDLLTFIYLLAGLPGFARDSCTFSRQIWYFLQCWPHFTYKPGSGWG